MQMEEALLRIQSAYPRIYRACHTRRQTSRVTGQELSPRDNEVLAHLSETRPFPQGLLARHLGVAKSTMSEALAWLEKRGLIARHPDPEDPRGAIVLRTAKGSAAMSRGSALEAGRLREALSALSSDELARAVDGLELLAKAAGKVRRGCG
jgi:DNA-binding MarR family transcriptional regulator